MARIGPATPLPPCDSRLRRQAPGGVKAAEPLRISPRDLGNKKQAVPGLAAVAWVSRGWLVCSFLRLKQAIVKKNYQGEGGGWGVIPPRSLLGGTLVTAVVSWV